MSSTISERELAFLLYEFLDTDALLQRDRYAEHSREVFNATLDTARKIAEDFLAPHFREGDENEPLFVHGKAQLIPPTRGAWRAIARAGFLNAHWNEAEGGLQLPEVVLRAAMSSFYAANVSTASYPMLTIAAANLLRAFGSAELKSRYLASMGDGRCAGTMALTEPAQGSGLADITTKAVPQADGSYRLFGQKMFISGGDQDLTENIVHMVLARIQGAPPGVRGISLFLVPKLFFIAGLLACHVRESAKFDPNHGHPQSLDHVEGAHSGVRHTHCQLWCFGVIDHLALTRSGGNQTGQEGLGELLMIRSSHGFHLSTFWLAPG